MAVWDTSNFGNDDAKDWLYKLEKSKGVNILLMPLKKVVSKNDFLEVPECCKALAAAEIIAASLSADFSIIPEEIEKWLEKKRGVFGKKPQIEKHHAILAKKATLKIMNGSELKDLWQENESFASWQSVQVLLLNKLKSV